MEIRTREQALEYIGILLDQFQISAAELTRLDKAKIEEKKSALLPSVLSYLGGLFIISGIGIFIGMKWDDMNSATRIISTLGTGTVSLILGILCHKDGRYQKAVAPLLVIAAGLQLTGILVTISELWPHGNDAELAFLIASGILFVAQIFFFTVMRRTSLVFLMMALGYAWVATYINRLGVDGDIALTLIGISIGFIAYHLQRTTHRILTPFWYFVSSVCVLWGGFELLQNSAIEILYIGICAGSIYLSTHVRSTVFLFNGSIALLGYLGYYSAEHFAHTVGWPITLIIIGILMIGIGSTAWKIRKKYIS